MERYCFGNQENKNRYLVIYDIADNKKRTKVAKLFEGYGMRVQLSAFEFSLTKIQYKKLQQKLFKIINDEDNIRIYQLNSKPIVHDKLDLETTMLDYSLLVC